MWFILQMITQKGSVAVQGKMAYVPQQAWVFGASVRDNILFGEEYDENRYQQVMNDCCLTADLEILPAGDKTEVLFVTRIVFR